MDEGKLQSDIMYERIKIIVKKEMAVTMSCLFSAVSGGRTCVKLKESCTLVRPEDTQELCLTSFEKCHVVTAFDTSAIC